MLHSFWNIRRKVLIFFHKFDEKRARTPRWVIRFTSKLQVKKNWSKGRTARHIFGREPSNEYFINIFFLLSKWFQTKRLLWEFPIGSYVKLSSAVWPSWSVFWNAGHNFGRGPPKNHFSKVWLRLAQ